MPYYQFHIPAGSPSAAHKAELAAAVTKVHSSVTGAPARYVNVAFFEVRSGEPVRRRPARRTRAGWWASSGPGGPPR